MCDWKDQLKEAYNVIRDKKKALKPDTSTKFDSEVNFKGRAGYNDTGIPLSPKTIKQKSKNKSMYAARAKAKYWAAGSQLKNINDQRAANARTKYKIPNTHKPVDRASGIIFKASPITRVNYPRFNDNQPRQKTYNYYDPIYHNDIIEVIPSSSLREIKFKNKVEEEIYRLKNKK